MLRPSCMIALNSVNVREQGVRNYLNSPLNSLICINNHFSANSHRSVRNSHGLIGDVDDARRFIETLSFYVPVSMSAISVCTETQYQDAGIILYFPLISTMKLLQEPIAGAGAQGRHHVRPVLN
jgi:hypothetical protein